MTLKGKVAYDIVETLDRATVAAASDGIGPFSPGGAAVPACVPSINVRTWTRRPRS